MATPIELPHPLLAADAGGRIERARQLLTEAVSALGGLPLIEREASSEDFWSLSDYHEHVSSVLDFLQTTGGHHVTEEELVKASEGLRAVAALAGLAEAFEEAATHLRSFYVDVLNDVSEPVWHGEEDLIRRAKDDGPLRRKMLDAGLLFDEASD
jgi:hypothetical protein